jgi:prophage regulatory protein
MHTILRLPDVKRSTGLSRSTIYLRITQGTFPKPVSLGGRAVGWLEAEVQQWLQRRIEASRSESSGVGATLGADPIFELKNHYELPIIRVIISFPPPTFHRELNESSSRSTLLFKKPRVNRTGNVSVDLFKGKTRGKQEFFTLSHRLHQMG